MDMDLTQLRTLVAAMEAGSLSGAARARHLTQPAVSLQIKSLEEELGTPLFHRRGRGVEPTEAGRALWRRARLVLGELRTAHEEVAQIRGLGRGSLRVGVTDAAATGLLAQAFVPFHRAYPGIEVAVEVGATGPLVGRLREGDVGLVLGTLPVEGADVETVPLEEEKLGLVAPAAVRGAAFAELLAREAFIAYPTGSTTRQLVDAALSAAGGETRPVMEIGRPSVMVSLVEAGFGVSVLPEAVSEPARKRGGVVRVSPRRFSVRRRLGLLRMRGREPEPAARAFMEMLLSGRTRVAPARGSGLP